MEPFWLILSEERLSMCYQIGPVQPLQSGYASTQKLRSLAAIAERITLLPRAKQLPRPCKSLIASTLYAILQMPSNPCSPGAVANIARQNRNARLPNQSQY